MAGRGPTILVVEDDQDERLVLRRLLEQGGYRAFAVEDGVLALEFVAEHRAELVLLDLTLPLIDGRDVLAELHETQPELPVIIISGAPDALERGRALGARAVLKKPFVVPELFATIAAVVSTAAQPALGRIQPL